MDKEKIFKAVENLFDKVGYIYSEENGIELYDYIPITCRLVNDKEDNHYCFACNMATSLDVLLSLVRLWDEEENYKIYRVFLSQIYLICEEVDTLLQYSGLSYDFIHQNMSFIYRIKRLMNFLKHPKARGFFNILNTNLVMKV